MDVDARMDVDVDVDVYQSEPGLITLLPHK